MPLKTNPFWDKDLFNYFVFYSMITWNIVLKVWKAEQVRKNAMTLFIPGLISLIFLAFFFLGPSN